MMATNAIVEQRAPAELPSVESTAVVPAAPRAQPVTAVGGMALMMERLAVSPHVDVQKLERLIAMQERILAHDAKAQFDAAFAKMQAEIPEISERGEIHDKGGNVVNKYARNEDIQKALRPILKKHGFALRFRTEWPDGSTVKVTGILAHRRGHAEESIFLSSSDRTGYKNDIQALGSAVSYGHRYTTKDLLNITSRGEDDDGARTSKSAADAPAKPAGYDDWVIDMESAADEPDARKKLAAAWNASKKEYRQYATTYDQATWKRIKATITTPPSRQKAAS